ncbi:MAG TPA: alpha/beta hydrolase [Candidatus Megaira endosymbiont of Hartmannula sinica]|nr:alpha/beta hydrolase [Candidatus Megaera endosymbiont of Hartmannula sinica]
MAEIFFSGPSGRIEARYSKQVDEKAPVALVLHPHPQYGGNMNNKVVYTIYNSFFNKGFTVLRINFRGVGRSEGTFDGGIGEMTDAATALDWLQVNHPLAKNTIIAGFSFGAWIALQLIMRRPEISHFIVASPPVSKYDFGFLSPCPVPGLVLQGDRDSVMEESKVSFLVDKLTEIKKDLVSYKIIYQADHFFRDKLNNLQEEIHEYLDLILKRDGSLSYKIAKKQNDDNHSEDNEDESFNKLFL